MNSAPEIPAEIGDAARFWAIRVGDPAFGDWEGFARWLEADPAHAVAYDAALDDEAWGTALVAALPAPPVRRAWWPRAVAACAALVAVIGGSAWYAQQPTVYATAPGERQTVELADGTRITLNGATRLSVAAGNPRQVALSGGEAVFEVRHDPAHPFAVAVDGASLTDLGTVFDVEAARGRLDVAVASGAVGYQGGGRAIRIAGGQALSRAGADADPVLRDVDAATVGAWRTGTLSYSDAPLGQVARDLARYLGQSVTVAPGQGARRFTGTLAVAGRADEVMRRAAAVMGVAIIRRGDGWQIGGDDGSSP